MFKSIVAAAVLVVLVSAAWADDEMDILHKFEADHKKAEVVSLTSVKESKEPNEPVVIAAHARQSQEPVVSLAAYGKRLGDAVLQLASASGYSVVFGPAVDPNIPIVVDLKDVPLDRAVDAITKYVNYGYVIDGNTITVNKLMTKRFIISQDAITVPLMSSEIGGDMTGASSQGSSGGGSGSGGGGSSTTVGGNSQNLKANVTVKQPAETVDGKKLFENNIRQLLSADGHYTVNWLSYSLMVSDSPHNIALVEDFMKNLNETAGEVLVVEATFTQVTTTGTLDYGIDWNLLAKNLGGVVLSNASGSAATTISTAITNIANPSLTITRTATDMSAVLKALQSQGSVKVLSRPILYTRNLKPTPFFSGTTNPYLSGVQQTTTGVSGVTTTSYNISTAQDGILLMVKCQILDDDYIDVQIAPVLASIQSWATFNVGGNSFVNPVSSVNETLQSVTLKDGETVIIGGIKQDKKQLDETDIPGLSQIPLIGGLFKSKNNITSTSEVVIALKVTKVHRQNKSSLAAKNL